MVSGDANDVVRPGQRCIDDMMITSHLSHPPHLSATVEQSLYRQLRRYAAMTVANCAAAKENIDHILGGHRDDAPYIKAML